MKAVCPKQLKENELEHTDDILEGEKREKIIRIKDERNQLSLSDKWCLIQQIISISEFYQF